MKEILLATANKHKLDEFAAILGSSYLIRSLSDFKEIPDIDETGQTLEDNAGIKARTLFLYTGRPTIADDSGLIVPFLDGAPGVRSARYAGEKSNDAANRTLLLKNLGQTDQRSAFFECVIAMVSRDEDIRYFSGRLYGNISYEERGENGFGYDSIFIPEGDTRTLAEYSPEEKNAISHRKKAIEQLIGYLGKDQAL